MDYLCVSKIISKFLHFFVSFNYAKITLAQFLSSWMIVRAWKIILRLPKPCKKHLCCSLLNKFIFLGPLSVDRFPEVDDDVEVDVEQCSDLEAPSRSRTPRTNNSRATPQSDEERLTPEPVRKKVKFYFHFSGTVSSFH